MTQRIKFYWNSMIRIGHHAKMDQMQEMRLFTLNAFVVVASILTLLFVVVFSMLGSYKALQGLIVIPALLIILYCNAKGWLNSCSSICFYFWFWLWH